MSRYLVFSSLAAAQARSRDVARAQGAGDATGDVTQYWFGAIEHAASGQGALEIPLGDETKLTADEQAALVDRATMEAAGWFAVSQ